MKNDACAQCISLRQRIDAAEKGLKAAKATTYQSPATLYKITNLQRAVKMLTEALGDHLIVAHRVVSPISKIAYRAK